MPVRYLSDPELARLSSWLDEVDVADSPTFTLSGDDLSWIAGFSRAEVAAAIGWPTDAPARAIAELRCSPRSCGKSVNAWPRPAQSTRSRAGPGPHSGPPTTGADQTRFTETV